MGLADAGRLGQLVPELEDPLDLLSEVLADTVGLVDYRRAQDLHAQSNEQRSDMHLITVWTGTQEELDDLLRAIERNCTCRGDLPSQAPAYAAHAMLLGDQTAIIVCYLPAVW